MIDPEQILDILWLAQYSQTQKQSEPVEISPPVQSPLNVPEETASQAERTESSTSGTTRSPETRPHEMQVQEPTVGFLKVAETVPQASTVLGQVRELRPLRLETASSQCLKVLPEESARRSAEAGFSWLVFEPATEPLYRLVLVRDHTPTTFLWGKALDRFEASLRIICPNLLVLHSFTDKSKPELKTPRGREFSTRQLRDSPGRYPIVVATDARGTAWSSPEWRELLTSWARVHPTSLLLLTPESLWGRTVLSQADWVQVGKSQARPGLDVIRVRERHWLQSPEPGEGPPLLFFTLEAASLRRWARFLQGQESLHPGLLFNPVEPIVEKQTSREERLQRFLSNSSPAARKMLSKLAAVPLQPEYLRRVFPEQQSEHLAEVLHSDLVLTSGLSLEFAPGVRTGIAPSLPTAVQALREVDDLLQRDYQVNVEQLLIDPSAQTLLWRKVPALAEFVPQIPDTMNSTGFTSEHWPQDMDTNTELALQRALTLAESQRCPVSDEHLWRALEQLHYEDTTASSQALSALYLSLPLIILERTAGTGFTSIAMQVLAECKRLDSELGFHNLQNYILPTVLLRTTSPYQFALQHSGWERQHWQRLVWKELATHLRYPRSGPKPDVWLRWLDHPLAGFRESLGDDLFWEVENDPAAVRPNQNQLRQWASQLSLDDRTRAWLYLRQQTDWPPYEEILTDQSSGFDLRLTLGEREKPPIVWLTASASWGSGSYLKHARDHASLIEQALKSQKPADGECILLDRPPGLLVQMDNGNLTLADLTQRMLRELESRQIRCLSVALPISLDQNSAKPLPAIDQFLDQLRARPTFRRTYFTMEAKDLGWLSGDQGTQLVHFWNFLQSSEALKVFAGRLLPASEADILWVWEFLRELTQDSEQLGMDLQRLEHQLKSARLNLDPARFAFTPQFGLMLLLYSVLDLSKATPPLPKGVDSWLRNPSDFEDLTRPRELGQPDYLPRVQWHPRLAEALEAAPLTAPNPEPNLSYLRESINQHQEVWPQVCEEEPAVRKLYLQLRARQLIHRLQTLAGRIWLGRHQVVDFFPDFPPVPDSLFYSVPVRNHDLHQLVVEAQVGPEEGGFWRLLPMRPGLEEYGAQLEDMDFLWLRAQQLLWSHPDLPDDSWRVWKLRDQSGNEFHLTPNIWPQRSQKDPLHKEPFGYTHVTRRGWTVLAAPPAKAEDWDLPLA